LFRSILNKVQKKELFRLIPNKNFNKIKLFVGIQLPVPISHLIRRLIMGEESLVKEDAIKLYQGRL
jgi:hypothetical protein